MNGRTVGQLRRHRPAARIAAYKACWAAPDPGDDGCATADLVSAIDRATADGVDVLNLAVAGPPGTDTVERALLGAAEADIVVVGAAGNDGRAAVRRATPARGSPRSAPSRGSTWRAGSRSSAARRLTGASRSRRVRRTRSGSSSAPTSPPPAPVAATPRSAAPAPSTPQGRRTGPSYCVRGGIGRVDKSEAVARADGVAMVLVNDRPGGVVDDFHASRRSSSTARDGRRLTRWVRTPRPHRHPDVRRRARSAPPAAPPAGPPRATPAPRWSSPTSWPSAKVCSAPYPATGWALFSGTLGGDGPRQRPRRAAPRPDHDWSRPGRPVRAHHHRAARSPAPRPCARAPGGPGADVRRRAARPGRRHRPLSPGPRRRVVARPQRLLARDARRRYRRPAGSPTSARGRSTSPPRPSASARHRVRMTPARRCGSPRASPPPSGSPSPVPPDAGRRRRRVDRLARRPRLGTRVPVAITR